MTPDDPANNPYRILDLDYQALGFRCGLEVHHQILTERKLFCHCPAGLYSTKVDAEVMRHMRPTLSELGEYDPCALMEFKTKKEIVYLLNKESVCTYEMDDTPPFPIDQKAVDIALEIAMLFGCQIVGEAHIARKQYLDGSIPTGFQRTTLVGVSGSIPFTSHFPPASGGTKGGSTTAPERQIGIIQLGLEEDACREVSDMRHEVQFRTDRLGMPLIEVVTESVLHHPYEVAEAGKLISQILRSTGKVRRGIGSVRQDVNVSVTGGTRVEIKGVPRIPLFPRLVSIEAYRQKRLLDLRDELKRRGITETSLEFSIHEMPAERIHFRTPKLASALERGMRIAAVRIPGIQGLLHWEVQPGRTFAHEIAGRVRVIACLDEMPNLFHTDTDGEFSLFPEEQTAVRVMTGAKNGDVVIILWGPDEDVTTGINEVLARIREATQGVPSETRQARKGGWTDFERLLPGPNRMYPDTDTPPTIVTPERVKRIRDSLPEPPWSRRERLRGTGLSDALADQMLLSPFFDLFWNIRNETKLSANRIARVLIQDIRAARRHGGHPDRITDDAWRKLFAHLQCGELNWEAVPQLVRIRSRRSGADWMSIATKQQMLPLAENDWQPIVDSALNLQTRTKFKESRIRWLMGQLQRPPGRIPAQRVAELLAQKVRDNHV
ncbi:Glu-tRNA(Gln) amidotransferase subunit GatE [candidate division KSB1 bacterium]|nr:MAG: Glu-tRNA(Gln) amidotransferase subunit GatE [candidate division KSB1 bacterium]